MLGVLVAHAVPSLAAHGIDISVDDTQVLEGDGGGLPNQLVFTISATIPALSPAVVQVDYATADFTAKIADSDYTAETGTAILTAASPTFQVRVDVTGDTKLERDEILLLGLTNAQGGHIVDGSGEGKIINDDGPSVSIDDIDADNGVPEGQGPLQFTVRLSEPVDFAVEVTFDTSDGTATAPGDYEAVSGGTVTIPAGDSSALGEVVLTDDDVAENPPTETFNVVLTNADAVESDAIVTISDDTGVMTIIDDDRDAVIEITDVAVAETDNTSLLTPTMATVTVKMVEGATADAIDFDYTTEDGTATGSDFPSMADYRNTSGSESIPAGSAADETPPSVEIEIPITGDTTPEAFETFVVRITPTSDNATSTKPLGTVTIQNDDATPSVNDVTVEEGADAVFVVSIAYPSIENVTVSYVTADGPATDDANAGDDYTTNTGNVTIEASELSDTVAVTTIDDEVDERGDDSSTGEQFRLNLTAGAGANGLADGQGVATLLDNDDPPMLSVGNPKFLEGNAGERDVQVTVMLVGNLTERDVTFDWELGADGDTATPDDDYDDASGAGEIEAGDRSTTVPVSINGDTIPEPDETVSVVTSNVVNAAPAAAAGIVTIENDDETVAVEDASFETEGDSGMTSTTVTVRIGKAQNHDITFRWDTQDSTETNAASSTGPGQDYTPQSDQEVTILAGQTTAEITVDALGDTVDETDEVFEVVLSNPSDPDVIIIDDTAVVTIPDDDGVSLRIDDAEVLEGDSGTTTMVFDVYLTGGGTAGGDVTFDWDTADGSATEGVILVPGDGDYDGDSDSGTISSGSTSTTIEVTVNGDTDPEDYETFTVTLSNVSGATEDDLEAIGTILNDDTELSIGDAAASEADGTMTFTVTASHASELDASAEVDTANGTATAGQDYTAVVDGNVTVLAGETTAQFTVELNDDDIDESDTETFTATLSNPTNASLGDATGTGTINDNDAPPSISAGDASVTEGDEDTTDVNVTLTLSAASDREITVQFATADGTAMAGEDYAANSGSATFTPGVTEVTVTLAVAGDIEDESDEHFFLNLSNPTNATLGDGTGRVTILDDDTTPSLSISDVSVAEDVEAGTATLSVTLSPAGKQTVTVEYASQNGSATAGEDYEAVSGLLTFNVGDTVKAVTVPINDDGDLEGGETFDVVLSNASNATIADGTGVVTIQDDETPPNAKPTVDAGPNRAVETATSQSYQATGSDPDGDSLTYTWNFGDGTAPVVGNPVSHAFDRVGLFTVNVTASDGKGGQATDSFTVNAFDTGVVGRSWGDDRILTAVAASQAHWPAGHAQASGHDGPAATDALIAHAYNYPDALAAGPLSAKLDAPLLLSDTASLPKVVEDELARLGVDTVWLLGGPNSLSPAIEQRLKDLGYEVERRSGNSRFDTAAAIAKEVGRNSTGEVVLTLGEHADQNRAFPDALSAGSLSASPQQMPLLLTRADDLPEVTQQALADLNTEKVWIVGGPSSVSTNVQARLIQLGYEVERLSGPGRYETSVDVAEEALSRAAAGPVRLVFATGAKFPDGLTGGAVAGRVDGILLLVPNGDLPAATRTFLADNADRFDVGVILGGNNTLSESVRSALVDLMDN